MRAPPATGAAPAPPLWALAGRAPGDEALRDPRRRLTWADLERATNAAGHGFTARGLVPGDHVALVAGNRVELVVALLGALRAGLVVTPVKTAWSAGEIAYLLDDAGTALVVTDVPAARAAAAGAGVGLVDLDDGFDAWLDAHDGGPLPAGLGGHRLSYTSGTTGRPKGVERAADGGRPFAESFPASARWARALRLPGDRPHLAVAQLFHGAPLTFGLAALAAGAPLWILDRWDPRACLDGLAAGAGSSCLVPSMFRELLALPGDAAGRDLSGVVTLAHGGEPCPPALKRRVLAWLRRAAGGGRPPELVEYYGFSEGGLTVVGGDDWERRPGTVGRPLPPAVVRILDEAGRPLPAGEVGAVYASLGVPRPFSYRNDPAKTDAAYQGDAFTAGDVGWVDEQGWLYLCGRAADVIVSAGVNLYPAQIEAALGEVPGLAGAVAEVCVVAGPHPVRGEEPVAVVVPAAGVDEVTARRAATEAAARLDGHLRPRRVRVRPSLPRDGTGKVLRRVLTDELWVGTERFAAGPPTAARPGGAVCS